LNNLIELTSILSNIKYFGDKALWEGIVKQLDEKYSRPAPQSVKYSGWNLDEYELDGRPSGGFSTENERYVSELRSSGKQVANLKKLVRSLYDNLKGSFGYRVLFRDGSITTTLDNFEETLDKERLRRGLEAAQNAGINVESALGRVKAN